MAAGTVRAMPDRVLAKEPLMFGLGIIGTILLIIVVLWLLGVFR